MDLDIDSQNLEDSDDNDEIQLTPAELIELMEEAWINEKFAPEILPHKVELVDLLLGQISYMENNLRSLDSKDFTKSIYQLEVDRLRFLISSYLRTRLEKIEIFTKHILDQENQRIEQGIDLYLTEQELKFARNFDEGLEQHFDNITSFYPRLPGEEQMKANQMLKPNMHSFVFLKSKNDIDDVVIDDGKNAEGDTVYLNRGSQAIISYKSISNLVKKGDVQLI